MSDEPIQPDPPPYCADCAHLIASHDEHGVCVECRDWGEGPCG